MEERKMVKLHIPGESFWAEDLGGGRYRVANCLMTDQYNLHDVVEAEPRELPGSAGRTCLKVTRLVERVRRGYALSYDGEGDREAVTARYRRIGDYLRARDVRIEGMTPGWAVIAVPVAMTEEELAAILAECPENPRLRRDEG